MDGVTLIGQLVCRDAAEAAVVAEHLPLHIASTRAEEGCLFFEVTRTGNPLVWEVSERFRDADAFELHQARVRVSRWGRVTAGIERRYTIAPAPGATGR